MSLTTHIQLANDAKDTLMRASLMTSNVAFVEAGCTGPSGNFTGSDHAQYDVAGTYLDDPSLTEGLSVACRVKPRNASSGYVFSTGSQTTGAFGVSIDTYQNTFRLSLQTRDRRWTVSHPISIVNETYHLVLRWDGESLQLYLDGLLVRTDTSPTVGASANAYSTLTIGKPNNVNNYYFDGLIEDVRCYDHAISKHEIVSIYTAKLLDLDLRRSIDSGAVKDLSRFQGEYPIPSGNSPTDEGDYGLTFLDQHLESVNRLRSGSFTLMAWCNFDIAHPWVEANKTGVNYYATVIHIPNLLTVYVHNNNDIRVSVSGTILWSGSVETLYISNPFTWGKEALVSVTYDDVEHVMCAFHNGRKIWEHPVILSGGYPSTLYVGASVTAPISYSEAFVGTMSRVQQYGTVLSDATLLRLWASRLTLDANGGLLSTGSLSERRIEWLSNVNRANLVDNGRGERGSNLNFSLFQYVEESEGDVYFQVESGTTTRYHDDLIPVIGNGLDQFDRYRIACDIRGGNVASRYYFMILCYDRNKRRIIHQDVAMRGGTNTTVAQTVNYGDEWIYLNDASNWALPSYGVASTYMNFCYWLNDPDPYVVYKYTRRRVVYSDADWANNRIRFVGGWKGPTLPAGTPVMNSSSGSTYSYIGAVNDLTKSDEWVHHEGQSSLTPSVGSMRYGSSYIRVGWLLNRNVSWAKSQIKNVKCWNVDRPQSFTFDQRGELVSQYGDVTLSNLSEVGVTRGLKYWYPLIGDATDRVSNQPAETSLATPTPQGYDFLSSAVKAYVDLRENPFTPNMPTFTVSAWVYRRSEGDGAILVNHLHGDRWESIWISTDRVIVNAEDTNSNRSEIYISTPMQQWFFMTVVNDMDTGELSVYLNAQLATAPDVARIPWDSPVAPAMGAAQAIPSFDDRRTILDGLIRDLRIHDVALTQEEIAQQHRLTSNDLGSGVVLTRTACLVKAGFSEVVG